MQAIHPGEHLAEELKELCMSAAEFSRQIGVPTNRVAQILNDRRSITGDSALRLALFFGTNAEFWLNLRSLYEIRLAETKSGRRSRMTNRRIGDHHAPDKVWTGRSPRSVTSKLKVWYRPFPVCGTTTSAYILARRQLREKPVGCRHLLSKPTQHNG